MSITTIKETFTQNGKLIQLVAHYGVDTNIADDVLQIFNADTQTDLEEANLKEITGSRVRHAVMSCTSSKIGPLGGGWHIFYWFAPTPSSSDIPILGVMHEMAGVFDETQWRMPIAKNSAANADIFLDYQKSDTASANTDDQLTLYLLLEVY